LSWDLFDHQGCRHRVLQERLLGQPGKVYSSDAVRVLLAGMSGDLEGQPRLAAPPGARERNQPVLADEFGNGVGLGSSSDQAGQWNRQVVRDRVEGSQQQISVEVAV
jgi:hypothetical protein